MVDASWAQVAGTVFLGLVGLWLAHSYRRQIGIKLAERRMDAYIELWTMMAVATPNRTTPLDRAERDKLHEEMNRWYFDEGNGLFMSTRSRDLFVAVQANLTCAAADLRPTTLAALLAEAGEDDADRRRGCVSVRHISLLRTQMKADVNLHTGVNFYHGLLPVDRDFLRTCGLSPLRRPWRRWLWGERGRVPRRLRTKAGYFTDWCVCGHCRPGRSG